ncbi:MAG: RIP metalloprotease RseP [Salinisphaeraceae bacterium]|nr:RIP metalloprotease RseP [Salinisphaeraceae bacterium]
MDLLQTILAFVVAIGLLVAVHEYGHFWTARKLGVRVLRFSIGFGPKLWGRTHKGTEYWIAAIPLGGYVKMLDEREAEVAPEDRAQAFNTQPVWKRILIVAAGPGVNFLLAILLYWLVLVMGTEGMRPLLAEPPAGSLAAEAGIAGGEEVLAINGNDISTWQRLRIELLKESLQTEGLSVVVRDDAGYRKTFNIDLSEVGNDPEELFGRLGLNPFRPKVPAKLGEIVSGEAAERAGLQPGDEIIGFNDQPVEDWGEFVSLVADRPNETVALTYKRNGLTQQLNLRLGSVEHNGQVRGRLGAGVDVDPQIWQDLRAEYRLTPWAAVPEAMQRTWDLSWLTLRMLGEMLVGEVSWRNVSGPLQIANYAGQSASIGLDVYLGFLALVSVSLGVLNLLPVPVLDGGHLLYYVIELVRGRPLSDETQAMGMRIGMAMLLLLMVVAMYNDVTLLFGGRS